MNINENFIPIQDFLSEQVKSRLLVTVDVGISDSTISVSPFDPRGGCLCRHEFQISRATVAGVIPTGEWSLCCGKNRMIVKLIFNDNPISASDFFQSQLFRAAVDSRVTSLHNTFIQSDAEASCCEPPVCRQDRCCDNSAHCGQPSVSCTHSSAISQYRCCCI
jgi:hypothetical protein